ncbi:MAG: right-handed parallel beta-helix repeat-containing protein [Chitinispirillaceae bacterium]|nr:right-handed parallel beta-helix repeat-containing protein [Chitinispirillaceae bacterium]
MKNVIELASFSITEASRSLLVTALFCLQSTTTISAATWFVSPGGNDANPGTIDQPFATLQKGHDKASSGDTVYLRGGTYKITSRAESKIGISITKSGTSDAERIYFWAYGDERPVLDFANLTIESNIGAGIRVQGKWLHFKGIEICNVKSQNAANNGLWCNPCTNNIFENMDFHHNQGPGLSIANGNGGLLILNCDAHDNFDAAKNGEDADGFGIHYQTSGDTIVLRGCRAWWNSDDGYDLFEQKYPVVVENCWAYGNGYINEGSGNGANGSGFKMGNPKVAGIRHTISNCVSWKNKNQGFYANHSPGGSNWYNNTSYNNGTQFDMLSDNVLSGNLVHVLRNNVAFPERNRNMQDSDTKSNTWDLNIAPANSDFESVSDAGWMGPRKPDGSLPDIPFLKLKTSSKLIDKGIDVGLPFSGNAPDLGAYEFGATTTATARSFPVGPAAAAISLRADGISVLRIFDLAGRSVFTEGMGTGFRLLTYKSGHAESRVQLNLEAVLPLSSEPLHTSHE